MQVKFKQELLQYKYLVMFDLASKKTGVCVFDLANKRPFYTEVIEVEGHQELSTAELQEKINNFFLNLTRHNISLSQILVSKERMPTQIHGGSSTVQTFVALARSHAILDTYLYTHEIATYDYIGVAPITAHSYIRKLLNLEKTDKITKDVIRDYVVTEYQWKLPLSFDEADAIFLAKTFIDLKWNNDIKEQQRELKRHKKTLKASSAIIKIEQEISRLNDLLLKEE